MQIERRRRRGTQRKVFKNTEQSRKYLVCCKKSPLLRYFGFRIMLRRLQQFALREQQI
jgi:hypothetical protein